MKILFKTIPNHTVSNKEKDRLKEAFESVGMEMTDNEQDYNIALIKSFSNTWNQVKHLTKPKVLFHSRQIPVVTQVGSPSKYFSGKLGFPAI